MPGTEVKFELINFSKTLHSGPRENDNETSGSIKGGEYLD